MEYFSKGKVIKGEGHKEIKSKGSFVSKER